MGILGWNVKKTTVIFEISILALVNNAFLTYTTTFGTGFVLSKGSGYVFYEGAGPAASPL